MNYHLTDMVKDVVVHTGTTAGTSSVNSSSVDMAQSPGFDAVRFSAYFATAASNNTIKLQQSSDNASADDWTDIVGSQVSVGASDELVIADIKRPEKRYLRAVALRGTSTVLGEIRAELYDPRSLPVANVVAGTSASEEFVTPAEGTA
jgi:hypothetical protein